MPLCHIALSSKDIKTLSAFYTAALAPLGYVERHNIVDGAVRGYGPPGKDADFWLSAFPPATVPGAQEPAAAGGAVHFAFRAESKEQVDAFHAAAIAAGGIDNGKPGPRQAFITEYAAFVFDPEGRNIEVNYVEPKA